NGSRNIVPMTLVGPLNSPRASGNSSTLSMRDVSPVLLQSCIAMGRNGARPETWKIVPGFPGYQISRAGQIRRRFAVRGVPPKILKPWRVRGYDAISLRHNGKSKKRLVRRLWALAFLGLRSGRELDHRRLCVASRAQIVRAIPGKANH